MEMVEKVMSKGYHLYMDNFHTSPLLFTSLLETGIGACGTLCNCKEVPSFIKAGKIKKGEIISEEKNELL